MLYERFKRSAAALTGAATPAATATDTHPTEPLSSLTAALQLEHPLAVYTPAAAPSPQDVDALHGRIATCITSGEALLRGDVRAALTSTEALLADAYAATAAAEVARSVPTTAPAERSRTSRLADMWRRHVATRPGDVYAIVGRRPPTISAAEVDRAVAALSAAERAALEAEFDLTEDGFVMVPIPDDLAAAERPRGAGAGDAAGLQMPTHAADGPSPDPVTSPVASEPTGADLGPQVPSTAATGAPPGESREDAGSSPSTQGLPVAAGAETPGFTLEAMPPTPQGTSRALTTGGADESHAEHTSHDWAAGEPAPATRVQPVDAHPRGWGLGPTFTVPPTAAEEGVEEEEETIAYPLTTTANESGSESNLSFMEFSRRMLQRHHQLRRDEGFRGGPMGRQTGSPPIPIDPPHGISDRRDPDPAPLTIGGEPTPARQRNEERPREVRGEVVGSPGDAGSLAVRREAFIRERVRDVLLANEAMAYGRDRVAVAALGDLHRRVLVSMRPVESALERLAVLVKEANVLLAALQGLEAAAPAARLSDPAQFLLVPRLRTTCFNPRCNATFSPVVPRQTCGRCGQTFCSQCCRDRGEGPAVVCNGQQVSLGWEPLCRRCFDLCEESQRGVAAERRRRRLLLRARASSGAAERAVGGGPEEPTGAPPTLTLPPPPGGVEAPFLESDEEPGGGGEVGGAGEAEGSPDIAQLTVKEAVLRGAYCSATRVLADGLPPFYVATHADDTPQSWDVLTYRIARARGELLAQYQKAGTGAQRALTGALQVAVQTSNQPLAIMPSSSDA